MDITSVASVGPVRPSSPFPFEVVKKEATDLSFGEVLKQAIEGVNSRIADADDKSLKLALGEVKDVHEVMMAIEKASISMDLTLEIRDRVLEAYQSIMRMAV